ncbi:pyridoxal phosphate-dependent aminotransferase [Pandoraea norimbergensis]|uniref:Aminotransferase n=1 Tax=Pandoraea norimbergensis TaxID=93219 RepID=A0ABM5WEE7_9BURK|nr:pyridoxal phosphate-dependent aminotransferase [Pandoraea norimbergensis]ALS58626.1 aminotransferase [Pandoraea norimbergensis]
MDRTPDLAPALKLAQRVDDIAPFHVMELAKQAALREKAGHDVIHMGIGEPDFTAPEQVIEAAAKAMRDGRTQYTSAMGLPALREAISDYYRSYYGVEVDPSRIVVTAGASAALVLACAALVGVGDEVLMPDPCYPCNRHFVSTFDGKPVLIPSGPAERFQLTAERIESHWGPATRGVLLASPSNPTGTSIETAELGRIVKSVRARGGFTLVDEIYQGLSYDGKPTTALSFGDDVLVVSSFSKYFNMTGWRLGWLVVPPSLVPTFEKLSQNLFICPSAVAQHAAIACFRPDTMAIYEARKDAFRNRRDYVVPALERLGFKVPVMPDGAFYVYADCSGVQHPDAGDSDRLTQALLQQADVVLVPGLDFGFAEPRKYIRLSYATSLEKLREAMGRIERVFTGG